MATFQTFPAGFSPGTGPSLVTNKPAITTGNVIWVDSINGSDSTGVVNRRELPFKTVWGGTGVIPGGYAASANGDIIILKASYTESITSAQSANTTGITIIGEGIGSQIATFTVTGALATAMTFSGTAVRLENIKMAASTAIPSTARLTMSGAGAQLINCKFDCGASDTADTVIVSGTYSLIDGCTFTSTAATPARGLRINTNTVGCTIQNCTFDGGSNGFSGNACDINIANLGLRLINNTFTDLADLNVITATRGISSGITSSGASTVNWTY